ncbi:MAG TPA: PCYCGC motif-containing (lipo)protein [Acidimicrobiales bacterium]|nr:PCYCGC motif-containing (lipo)protein [Acidimicrobiales bacterium]
MTAEAGPASRRRVVAWLVAALVPVLVFGVALGVLAGRPGGAGDGGADSGHGAGSGPAAAPLRLASVSPAVAAHYRYAGDHGDAYRLIPCYCGCEEFLDHRDLYDCFVRPDGRGWEAHAAGCGVCIGESATARRLLDEGHDPTSVRDAVIAQFGTTPATTPPRA